MRRLVTRMWAAAPLATAVLALALLAGLFFAGQLTARWIYWNDPAHREQSIAGWMTPGYIAHSWNVPREVIAVALGAVRGPDGPRNLNQLAKDQGRPVTALVAEAQAAIAAFRADPRPPHDGPPGDRP